MTKKDIGFDKFLEKKYKEYKEYYEKTFKEPYLYEVDRWYSSLGYYESVLLVEMYVKEKKREKTNSNV